MSELQAGPHPRVSHSVGQDIIRYERASHDHVTLQKESSEEEMMQQCKRSMKVYIAFLRAK